MRNVVRTWLSTLLLLLVPAVSHAQDWSSCTANSACIFQNISVKSGEGWNFDGTIPDDGRRWILRAFVTPGYTAAVQGPNQVDHFDVYRDGMGGFYYDFSIARYDFTGPSYVSGLSTAQWDVYDYYFQPGVRPFDNCATPGPADSKCGAFTNWFWNAGGLTVSGPQGVAQVQLGLLAVPEPASWAMLIIGFGLIGGVARRRAPLHAMA
ncbi:PEPxxWA-CTERM sorting domain-containing protein [Sphingomonas sp.]|uniref:PEPxxWA-CTERM sorting domain-containing protein n=1 Tax=Sphingomonas sp. TaxID=28214 RepID=UPI0028A6C769|nr:PEPxxWA-CTERM sorting domain-containing protein [Sphingomonas sp.]